MRPDWFARQIRDYCQTGRDLVVQRQVIFIAALLLAAYYYSASLALVLLALTIATETFDFFVFRRVLASNDTSIQASKRFARQITISTIVSSSTIAAYAIGIAAIQGPTTHFMSMFFLFAAGIFAAMNNHQLLPILLIRITIYGAAFLFIPLRDIVLVGADLRSELWAQFFASIFVLFFLVDCARVYIQLYRSHLTQLYALREEHDKAQVAYIAKSEFVSTMSHELRTPLTAIKGSIDMVRSGKLGDLPDQVEFAISVAQRNSDRLLSLINEILDLQSVESHEMKFEMSETRIKGIVEDAIADNDPYAAKLDIRLVSLMGEEDAIVKVDKKRLGQVLSNVLSNAAKFSPAHSEVTVSLVVGEDDVFVMVSDSGIGLSESDEAKVFEPFTQLDSSSTRKIGGTGLGMNISRRIMEALGGAIYYKKNQGAGTTFVIRLPIQAKPCSQKQAAAG